MLGAGIALVVATLADGLAGALSEATIAAGLATALGLLKDGLADVRTGALMAARAASPIEALKLALFATAGACGARSKLFEVIIRCKISSLLTVLLAKVLFTLAVLAAVFATALAAKRG